MDRKFIIAYGIVIAALALALVAQSNKRDKRPPDQKPAAQQQRPLSAILSPGGDGTKHSKHLVELRDRNQRLQIQLASLQAAAPSTYGEKELIEVDLEAFCQSPAVISDSYLNLNLEHSKMFETLALSEEQKLALLDLIGKFRSRLHRFEKPASVGLEKPRKSSRATKGEVVIEIPAKLEGRSELFDDFKREAIELLGDARGRATASWLSHNQAIGRHERTKEYAFSKQWDGSINVDSTLTVFYGNPDGDAVSTAERTYTSRTLQAEEAEAIFGNLIDLSSLPAR